MNINLHEHYKGKQFKAINYIVLGKEINTKIKLDSEVIKTYVFAYRPCDKLMKVDSRKKYYDWITNTLKKTPYLEVIEGRQELRTIKSVELDINDPNTYTTTEKETDINFATHMVAKGFFRMHMTLSY